MNSVINMSLKLAFRAEAEHVALQVPSTHRSQTCTASSADQSGTCTALLEVQRHTEMYKNIKDVYNNM